jgi:cystathionine beta-lyase/cystathionine gamma-synthase
LKNPSQRIETKLIHAGEPSPRIEGAVAMPIFQSANFEYGGEGGYHDVKYIRLNNTPNHTAVHAKLAALENAEAALVTASGMAAVSTAFLALVPLGGHVLAQDKLYGGTFDFLTKDFPAFGRSVDFIDGDCPESWEQHLRPNTKALYVETMSNPLLQVSDLPAAVKFAQAHNLISIIDNTFASPVNFRPPEHGFDLSLHSCTKYLNGHSDIVAGAIIGRAPLVDQAKHLLDHLGGSLDPHACFLLHRGMKTLAVRVAYQNRSAQVIAEFLSQQPQIARVNYPGLARHPRHDLARKLFDGFGGMLSFEMKGGIEATEKFLRKVRLPIIAPSLGGVETLAIRPATTSHAGMSPQDRARLGITDSLIRISIGIEATEDIIEDFSQALRA